MRPKEERRRLVWVSAGAASAVAARLTVQLHQNVELVYCDTGAEHPDNRRFLDDVARWCGKPVTTLRSEIYKDTWDVFEKTRYLAGIHGARCTTELKIVPRTAYQKPYDIHVFGYTADVKDKNRAKRLKENFFELTIETPLIDRGITHENCLGLLKARGIEIPVLYKLGFNNNNCIPCVKVENPGYWARMRKYFPAEFERMAKLSRELDVRLAVIKGERVFIDDIPLNWPTKDARAPACDFLCRFIERELDE